MRICCVVNAITIGGAERILCHLMNEWAASGHEISLLTFDDGKLAPAFELNPNIAREPLGIGTKGLAPLQKLLRIISIPKKLRESILQRQPEVVLSFMDQTNIFSVLALRKTQIPILVAERSNPDHSSIVDPKLPSIIRILARQFRNFVYRYATKIVVQTQGAAKYFPKHLQQKISAIPNPVRKSAPGASFSLNRPCIVSVGRLAWPKRFDLLFYAFSKITNSHPNWSLYIVGDGPDRERLERIRAELNLSDKIFLLGMVDDPGKVFLNADIFALVTDSEGFPGALCEAMAFGLPCVASDCDFGPRDIISNGEDGLLTSPGDESSLTMALLTLLEDVSLREKFKKEAPKILDRLDSKVISEKWLNLFRESIGVNHSN